MALCIEAELIFFFVMNHVVVISKTYFTKKQNQSSESEVCFSVLVIISSFMNHLHVNQIFE